MAYGKCYIEAKVSFSEADELSRNIIGECLQYGATQVPTHPTYRSSPHIY
jgi:hypothetical protein